MKTLTALLCAAALGLLLSGCGSEGGSVTAVSSATAAAAIPSSVPSSDTAPPLAASPTASADSGGKAPVNNTADTYISSVSESLLAMQDITEPDDFKAALALVDTPSLKGITAWIRNKGLTHYVGSGGDGGIYLQDGAGGRDIGFYAGSFDDGGLRSGDRCVWVTLQSDDDKIYTGSWSADFPNGSFRACSLTTNNGNLVVFSGSCVQGVWDGPVTVTYVEPGHQPLEGDMQCDDGHAPVALRPDNGQYWISDTEIRFCFIALDAGGGRYIPLYRKWTDMDFVVRMAFDPSLIKA
jgi:hypothetical protein